MRLNSKFSIETIGKCVILLPPGFIENTITTLAEDEKGNIFIVKNEEEYFPMEVQPIDFTKIFKITDKSFNITGEVSYMLTLK